MEFNNQMNRLTDEFREYRVSAEAIFQQKNEQIKEIESELNCK